MATATKRAMAAAARAMAMAMKRAKAARAMATETKRAMMAVRAMVPSTREGDHGHHRPANILGFFGGKKNITLLHLHKQNFTRI